MGSERASRILTAASQGLANIGRSIEEQEAQKAKLQVAQKGLKTKQLADFLETTKDLAPAVRKRLSTKGASLFSDAFGVDITPEDFNTVSDEIYNTTQELLGTEDPAQRRKLNQKLFTLSQVTKDPEKTRKNIIGTFGVLGLLDQTTLEELGAATYLKDELGIDPRVIQTPEGGMGFEAPSGAGSEFTPKDLLGVGGQIASNASQRLSPKDIAERTKAVATGASLASGGQPGTGVRLGVSANGQPRTQPKTTPTPTPERVLPDSVTEPILTDPKSFPDPNEKLSVGQPVQSYLNKKIQFNPQNVSPEDQKMFKNSSAMSAMARSVMSNIIELEKRGGSELGGFRGRMTSWALSRTDNGGSLAKAYIGRFARAVMDMPTEPSAIAGAVKGASENLAKQIAQLTDSGKLSDFDAEVGKFLTPSLERGIAGIGEMSALMYMNATNLKAQADAAELANKPSDFVDALRAEAGLAMQEAIALNGTAIALDQKGGFDVNFGMPQQAANKIALGIMNPMAELSQNPEFQALSPQQKQEAIINAVPDEMKTSTKMLFLMRSPDGKLPYWNQVLGEMRSLQQAGVQ